MSDQPRLVDRQEASGLPSDDPVIEQVRDARRRPWEAAGRDVRTYVDQARESDRRRRAERAGGAKP